jgi:hypothetical protein
MYKYIYIAPVTASLDEITDINSDYNEGVTRERALAESAPHLAEHAKYLETINAELLAVLERVAMVFKQGRYPELQGVACDAFAAILKARSV